MNSHASWEMLNDYLDDILASDQAEDVTEHLSGCDMCRSRLDELEATVRKVADMARDIAPPDGAWPAIRAELERRKVVEMPGTHDQLALVQRTAVRRHALLAAAALLLIASSSTVTLLVLRSGDGSRSGMTAAGTDAPVAAVAVHDVERGYIDTVRELTDALETARPHLAAETIGIVERNLTLIDAAIEESREALRRDPGNLVLQQVLAGTYRQKLELLRRAAQLAAS